MHDRIRAERREAFMSEFVVVTDPRPGVRVIALNRPEKKNALMRQCTMCWSARSKPPMRTGMSASSA
jgi:hypothetical protein